MSAAAAAGAIASSATPSTDFSRQRLGAAINAADRYPMLQDWRSADTAGLVPFLKRLDQRIRSLDS